MRAKKFVELAKYPPIGRRGASTTTAAAGYTLGTNPAGDVLGSERWQRT